MAIFAGDGTALVVALALSRTAPLLYIPAEVLSPTEGKIVRWREDLVLAKASSAGDVRLDRDGRQLRIRLPDTTLQAGDCRFTEYVGEFVGMVEAPPADR